ncbi:lipid A biosynthesis acyltransferase [Vitreoscilla filiformis]|uniref:Lipid A biosynthesis acyltransferase n=1 Tax=Vitreoscilla filiformis TaxID=63 RepID=A0A221KC73_VITFI|nr:lysophospholipid acyltransferase family protein [Vitreoscilla filiformis]ASM76606.1 lipid A biosynthesis acyltransferase [Vitreoscilla filiformis]
MKWLLRSVAGWPLGLVAFVGGSLGWLTWLASPTYRRRLAANATLAGLNSTQRRQSVAEIGRLFLEVPWLWFRDRQRPILPLIRAWHGTEHVEEALRAGRGLVLLTPHLGCFEMSACAYAERFGPTQPITVLYRPAKQPWLADVQTTARTAPHMQAAPASLSGVRQMIRALRKGETLGLLPDQVPPEGQGAWAPFFGQPAYTMTLAARLVQQTGCAVLLTWCERLPGAQGFVMHYAPLPSALPKGDEAAAAAINAAMEWTIRHIPHQYLWGYNRYKGPRSLPATLEAGA